MGCFKGLEVLQMIVTKLGKGSVPNSAFVMKDDYYVFDRKTVETLCYVLDASDLDTVLPFIDKLVDKIMECINNDPE